MQLFYFFQPNPQLIMSNNGKVLLGIVTAAAAGAVIGMLFAPEKGTDFRQKLSGSANDLLDELTNALSRGKEEAGSLVNKWGSEASRFKDKVVHEADAMKDRVQGDYQNAKGKVKSEM